MTGRQHNGLHLISSPSALISSQRAGKKKMHLGKKKVRSVLISSQVSGIKEVWHFFLPVFLGRKKCQVHTYLIPGWPFFSPTAFISFHDFFLGSPCTYLFPCHALLANARSKLRLPAPSHALLASARSTLRLTAPITPTSAPPHGSSRTAR